MTIETPTKLFGDRVRVLDVSQLLKEHITDMILEANKRAALAGFNEECFDMFGYVDARDKAYLRLEARRDLPFGGTPSTVLVGCHTMTYKEMTPDFLKAWDAGYVCWAPRSEVEVLVHAPSGPVLDMFKQAVEGWKQSKQGETDGSVRR
jgi:hypothetical protein